MEYLMTYGWAILIIAVVLGALAGLGLFSGNSLTPKATAGSCSVYRPGGAFSSSLINLVGVCNGELPQYVAKFDGAAAVPYNGYITTGTTGLPLGNSQRSVFAWIYYTGTTAGFIQSYGITGTTGAESGLYLTGGKVLTFTGYSDDYGTFVPTSNAWHFVGYVYSAGATNAITVYLDGQKQSANLANALSTSLSATNPSTIGIGCCGQSTFFTGSIANLQIYNTSFSQNDVIALYDEGIGGAPIALPWLVAWWPLNGNGNDYSGNGNNANIISNVIYTTGWTSGYTAPP
jgi:hypothetical protein